MQRWVRELAPHDWLVLGFVVILNLASYSVADATRGGQCLQVATAMLAVLLVVLGLVRSGWLRDSWLAPLLYRVAIYGSVQLSYFFLGWLLPMLNRGTLDTELYALDLALFGFEPALAMDGWVTPLSTEWFAFFYYSYFLILALHVVPILFGSRSQRLLGEFALGMLLVFCLGHVGYMLVPGYGPYWALADEFQRPLPSGLWADLVMVTVASGGSQLDIFPSLHTAAPAFITLYAFRHRSLIPYRYTWLPTAFFSANIIVATMYLRWHYVIDVVAGVVLACAAAMLSVRITQRELRRRNATGLTPNWPLFFDGPTRNASKIVPAARHSA